MGILFLILISTMFAVVLGCRDLRNFFQKPLVLSSDAVVEKTSQCCKLFSSLLIFFIINNLTPSLVYYSACRFSGKCSEDDMGGAMMIYAFTLFIPNCLFILTGILHVTLKCFKSRSFFAKTDYLWLCFYLVSLGWMFRVGFRALEN